MQLIKHLKCLGLDLRRTKEVLGDIHNHKSLQEVFMEEHTKLSRKRAFIAPIIILIVLGGVLFVPAGSLRFWAAWIFWLGFSVLISEERDNDTFF